MLEVLFRLLLELKALDIKKVGEKVSKH